MTTSTDAARESARQNDGKFGHQHHAEPAFALTSAQGAGTQITVPAAEWSPFRHSPRSLDQLWPTRQKDFNTTECDIPETDRARVAAEFELNFEPESVELEGNADYYDERNYLDVTFKASGAGGYKNIEFTGDPLAGAALFTARCAPHPDPVEVLEAANGKTIMAWDERGYRKLVGSSDELTKHGAVLASRTAAIDHKPALAWSHGETGWDEVEKRRRHAEALVVAAQRLSEAEANIPVRIEVNVDRLQDRVVKLTDAGLALDVSPRESFRDSVSVTLNLADVRSDQAAQELLRADHRLLDWLDPHQGTLDYELAQWDHRPDAAEIDAMATEKTASLDWRTPWDRLDEEQKRARKAVLLTAEDYRRAITSVCDAFEATRD